MADKNIELQVNPEKVVPAEAEKTLERLEKNRQKCNKIEKICGTVAKAITGLGAMSGFAVAGSVIEASLGTMVGLAVSAPFLVTAGIALAKEVNLNKKIDNLRKKLNPDAYYKELINNEKESLKEAGVNLQGNSAEKQSKENVAEDLSARAEKVAVLEDCHQIAKQCGKEKTIRRLTDLAQVSKSYLSTGEEKLLALVELGMGGSLFASTFDSATSSPIFAGVLGAAILTAGAVTAYDAAKNTKAEKVAARSEGLLKQFAQYKQMEKA